MAWRTSASGSHTPSGWIRGGLLERRVRGAVVGAANRRGQRQTLAERDAPGFDGTFDANRGLSLSAHFSGNEHGPQLAPSPTRVWPQRHSREKISNVFNGRGDPLHAVPAISIRARVR